MRSAGALFKIGAEFLNEPIEESRLTLQEAIPRFLQGKPCTTIDFGNLDDLA